MERVILLSLPDVGHHRFSSLLGHKAKLNERAKLNGRRDLWVQFPPITFLCFSEEIRLHASPLLHFIFTVW